MTSSSRHPTLTVHLPAIVENYRRLKATFKGRECAGVVKADAYGLGLGPVAQALLEAGCRTFFVATLEEGIKLRSVVQTVPIAVFHGPYPGEEQDYLAHRLMPVLNHPEQ